MLRSLIFTLAATIAFAAPSSFAQGTPPPCADASCSTHWVYFGTRANGPGQGIHAARFDASSGRLSAVGLVAEVARPTWLIAHPKLPVLYAVSEANESSVFSFAADKATGQVRVINSVGSGGGGSTHLAYDEKSKSVFVASYGTGQVSWLPTLEEGRLGTPMSIQSNYGVGPHRRQTSPHAHGVTVDPTHRFVLAPDLGADRVFVYRFDAATRQLTPATPPFMSLTPGSGPRHLVFHPNGRFAFVITELSAEVVSYKWDAKLGRLQHVQTVPAEAPGFTGQKSSAEIEVSVDGRFVYASNRGTDSIVVYAVSSSTGTLHEIQRISSQGKTPWSFAFDPSGRWMLVANYGSNAIAVFAVDSSSGELKATQESLAITQPSNVTFLHAGE